MKKVKQPKNFEEALKVNAELQKVVIDLQQEIVTLKELLGLNSQNSSIPPSQDRSKKKLNANLLGVSLVGSQAIRESQEDY